MKTLIIGKLLEGKYAEVRDYQLGKDLRITHCLAEDRSKCFHEGEDVMILKVSQQKKGKVVNKLQSKFYPYKYNLIYKFLFKPMVEKKEIEVPNVLQSMSEYATGDKWAELGRKLHS